MCSSNPETETKTQLGMEIHTEVIQLNKKSTELITHHLKALISCDYQSLFWRAFGALMILLFSFPNLPNFADFYLRIEAHSTAHNVITV